MNFIQRYKIIIIISLFLSGSFSTASAVCCCADPAEILDFDNLQILKISSSLKLDAKNTLSRIQQYEEFKKRNNSLLLFNSRSLASAVRLKDAVSIKEDFEGLAASTALDNARVENASLSIKMRDSVGKESEDFTARIK